MRRGSPPGFTLIEVMVAFIIVAFALMALLQGDADGLRGVIAAGRTEEAVALAQARLSAFAAQPVLTAGELQGDDADGFHWRLLATPLGSLPLKGPIRRLQQETVLYRVAVTVSWMAGPHPSSVSLESQRLTPLPLP